MLDQLLVQYIAWKYWRYSVSELSVVLLIWSQEELPAVELKKALEEMNYEFTAVWRSRAIPVSARR
ncbi:MAG: hypothetical protein ACLR2E_23035 [Lachnospiraceae bacterium]